MSLIVNNILTKLQYGFIAAQNLDEERFLIPFEKVVPLRRYEEYFLKTFFTLELDGYVNLNK